jgi:hypothetical protein
LARPVLMSPRPVHDPHVHAFLLHHLVLF